MSQRPDVEENAYKGFEQSLGVSNNFSDYAKYNPKVDSTLNYLQRDGSLARSQQRALYRNDHNLLVNKKSQEIARHYVSPYSQRLEIVHSAKLQNSSQTEIHLPSQSKERRLYTYDEIYSHGPQYTMSTRSVVHRPAHEHIH